MLTNHRRQPKLCWWSGKKLRLCTSLIFKYGNDLKWRETWFWDNLFLFFLLFHLRWAQLYVSLVPLTSAFEKTELTGQYHLLWYDQGAKKPFTNNHLLTWQVGPNKVVFSIIHTIDIRGFPSDLLDVMIFRHTGQKLTSTSRCWDINKILTISSEKNVAPDFKII